jgi:hypothetical protein
LRPRSPSTAVRSLLLLVAPALTFAAYSAYFYRAGYPITYLAHTYRGAAKLGGALTADMLNIWCPVAEAFRAQGQQIYEVTRPTVVNSVAEVLTAILLFVAAAYLVRERRRLPFDQFIAVALATGTLILPMTMTRAHENHFFLAALLGTALVGVIRTRVYAVALTTCLTVQFVYLFSRYGLGVNHLSRTAVIRAIHHVNTYGISTGLAVVNVCAAAVLVVELLRRSGRLQLARVGG